MPWVWGLREMDDASGNLRRGEGFKICSSLACGVKDKNLKQVSVSLCLFFFWFLHPQIVCQQIKVWSMFLLLPIFFWKILPPQ